MITETEVKQILQQNLPYTAEQLLKEGSRHVKLAIVSLYVYSITGFMHLTGVSSGQVKELLTPSLLCAYNKQEGF